MWYGGSLAAIDKSPPSPARLKAQQSQLHKIIYCKHPEYAINKDIIKRLSIIVYTCTDCDSVLERKKIDE